MVNTEQKRLVDQADGGIPNKSGALREASRAKNPMKACAGAHKISEAQRTRDIHALI